MWKAFLIFLGFAAASFTTVSSGRSQIGYERSQIGYGNAGPRHVGAPAGYDQSQHEVLIQIPGIVNGEPVAFIFLMKGRFDCPVGQARAVLIQRAGAIWIGCYSRDGQKVHVRFEDGDEINVRVPPEA